MHFSLIFVVFNVQFHFAELPDEKIRINVDPAL